MVQSIEHLLRVKQQSMMVMAGIVVFVVVIYDWLIHHSTIWFALAFSFTTSSYNHLEPIIGGTSRTGVRLVERPMLVYLNAVGWNVDADAVAVDIAADDGDDDDDGGGGGGRNNNNYFTVCVYDFFAQYVCMCACVCMCGSKFVLNHSESTARHGARTQDVPQTHSLSLTHTHTLIYFYTHTHIHIQDGHMNRTLPHIW